MAAPGDVRDVAVRLLAICERRFRHAGASGDLAEVASVLVDTSWNPEEWCQENDVRVEDVLRHTRDVDVSVGVVIAAMAMLELDRFTLVRLWERSFQWRDLVTIAAATCERLPEPS